ncbi:uncharacterized protein LOC123264277 isoform X2 [Cotesia glomerata]|uniref:uncharacterized protein LOC123264277 isoform X2 n=1 Tax=Cotesia glomerata TaxID=32391 RepID=UPI001D01A82E|nr:uncharacterized protein LOC123264277 isoform X2 [Cotesia glomerata]
MDDFYDPDLEARLYAEVHYTNDSYSEANIDPRALAPEGDVPPGSIRSYAKKTGMIPKKHRALIDGPRTLGSHRMQEPAPRQEFRSNQSDLTRTIPSLFSLDPAIPPVPPRFSSPNPPRFTSTNPSRLNIPISSRLGPSISSRLGPPISPIPTGFTPLDSNRPNIFGNYPPDYPRSGHLLDPTAISFDNSRLPPYMYNQAPNFQLNPYASDNFNQNLLDPYSSPRQDLPHFNQPDFIRLTQSSPSRSKAQSRKDSHMANLKDFAKKVRNRRRRERTRKNRKLFKGNKNSIVETNSSTPRKNPDRAARHPDVNKSSDGTKDVVNLNDSIEVIEIQESANDNLTQSNLGSQVRNDEMSQGESVDDLDDSEESLDESEGKLDDNLDKSGDNLEKSDNSDKSKNLDKSEENLKTPNRNLDKSDKNLDKSSKNLDKSNDNLKTPSKNLEKSDHNLDKTKNLNKSDENLTPSKNLDKSNKNQDKFDQNLTPSRNSDKSNKNQDKSDQNSTPSRNLDKSNKNQDKSDQNLTPRRNLDKSNKNQDKSDQNLTPSRNLDKSNRNSEKPGHNIVKSKTLETPSKNLAKSNPNLDKSDQNLTKSDENLDHSQKSVTPTKDPENKDPNLISKSRLEPSSKDNNSKYNIKSPSKFSKSMATLDSSSDSDSDESIFEVPVPPKPAPPLINLNDSDESDDSDSEEDSQDVPSKINLEEDENENDDDDNEEESSEKQIWDCDDDDDDDEKEEDNSNSEKQVWNCDDDDDDDDVDDDEEKEEDRIEANFVLNCSQVQKAVPTLEELKKVNLTNLEAKDDPKVLETITDTTEATASTTTTTTTIITEDSGDKSRQSAPKNLGSDKKRPRDESRNRDDSLKPIKVPRSDKSKDNTSFEEYVSKPMPVSLRAFYTDYRSSGCMNDVMDVQHKMSRNPNLWAILDADLVCRGGDKRLRCSYCHQPGHKRENCPDKRKLTLCHMCGEGGHSESRCPQRMCLTCGKKYSSYRKTCEYCRKLQCTLCKSVGHLKTNCPDLWRRYHQTTTSEGVNIPPDLREVLKPSHKLYCCNCTRRGHESSTCSRYRWSSHFPSPISVTSYTEGPSYPIRESVEIPPEAPIALEAPIPPEVPTPPKVPIPPKVPDPPPREEILFHYQNYRVIPEDWCSDTIYPLEIPNISYNLESSKHQVPKFLTKHFPEECHCYIYVHIKLTVPDKLVVELKTPSAPSTLELKKLMIQWMSRRKEDRNKMTLTPRLPVNKALLLNALLDKFYDFITNSSLRGLLAYDYELEERTNSLGSKMESCRVNSIQASKFKNRLRAVEPRFSKKLLCSLYNFKLAPSAEAIINDFHKLLNLLSSDNAWEGDHGRDSLVPQAMYMNFCWFNFELFTLHLSDYIVHAKNLFLERVEQLKMRNIKKHLWAQEMGLKLMFNRSQRVNFLSEGFKPGVLKPNKCKERHRQFAKSLRIRANARTKNKQNKNKNNSNDSKSSESGNDDCSRNNDSSQNFGGSGNNDSSKNISGSRNNDSFKTTGGSGNSGSSKNTGGSGNSGSSKNIAGSGNSGSSKNIAGSGNSYGFKKPKEKPTSLIVDGKINLEILQREKLACRAQAAVDLAKKHGLRDYADRAELMVKKIKNGGMVKKNAIEQLWSFLVKELRGNNINFQN